MNRIVSATDVHTRFDEIIRQAKTDPVIVKRYGKPEVVIISKQEYDQLMLHQAREERDTQLFMAQGEEHLRQLASKHGLNWDKLSEDERERFVDNLLHEK